MRRDLGGVRGAYPNTTALRVRVEPDPPRPRAAPRGAALTTAPAPIATARRTRRAPRPRASRCGSAATTGAARRSARPPRRARARAAPRAPARSRCASESHSARKASPPSSAYSVTWAVLRIQIAQSEVASRIVRSGKSQRSSGQQVARGLRRAELGAAEAEDRRRCTARPASHATRTAALARCAAADRFSSRSSGSPPSRGASPFLQRRRESGARRACERAGVCSPPCRASPSDSSTTCSARYPRRPGDPPDVDAEYEPEATVCALEAAIARLGHRAGAARRPARAARRDRQGRAAGARRRALDRRGLRRPQPRGLGARAARDGGRPGARLGRAHALALRSTRRWRGRVVAAAGVPVAAGCVLARAPSAESAAIPAAWPLFVKPRWEGTAKGIGAELAGRGPRGARARGRAHRARLPPARAGRGLPARRRVHGDAWSAIRRARCPCCSARSRRRTRIGIHALERHPAPAGRLARASRPVRSTPRSRRELGALALRAFDALECRDFARADFRLDAAGRPRFLEINPLPTFAPDGSFGILAELEGRPLEALLADVIASALARLGLAPRGMSRRASAAVERLDLADAAAHPQRGAAARVARRRRRTSARASRSSPSASTS